MSEIPSYLIEFIGTFFFLSVILVTGSPIPIVVALLAVIYLGGNVSGGHYNPAVTFMFWLDGASSISKSAVYIVSQLLGATAAFYFYNQIIKPNVIIAKSISQ